MNFLNPFFLFGLLAVAIPVVIHLINLRRPQKISFSTLSFFNELRKSTIRRIRIKQYLLMALRALALLFLALALARPFLPPTITGSASSGEPKAIGILIDNSASMSRIGAQGPLIDQAREVAERIVVNANSEDKFYLATTNPAAVAPSGMVNGSRALSVIPEISAKNTGHYTVEQFREVYKQLEEAPQPHALLYIISDGQESQLSDLSGMNGKSDGQSSGKPVTVQLVSLEQSQQQNLAISSMELQNQMISRESPITLSVEVENVGNAAAANQFVSVEVGGELSGQYEVTLQPGATKKFDFQLVPGQSGDLWGRVLLEGDEVEYDNSRNFVVKIPEMRSILLVTGDEEGDSFTSYLSPALQAARQNNAQLNVEERTAFEVDQSEWASYDAIVLDGIEEVPSYWFQDLQRYIQQGNGLLFLPSEQGDIENYNSFFSLFNAGEFTNVLGEYGSFEPVVRMAELEEGHPVLEEIFRKEENEQIKVDLSSLFYYFRYEEPSNSAHFDILKAANGDPLLSEQQFGKGVLLVSTLGTDPGWSNLPVNPLFAPLFYRSTLYASSTESAGLRQQKLGEPFVWEGSSQASEVSLELNGAEYKPQVERLADGIRLTYEGREWKPGIVSVNTPAETHKVAVNLDIMESRVGTLTNEKWQEILPDDRFDANEMISARSITNEDLEQKLSATMFGKEIWNWFIWIALLFLLTETAVSRLYKAESIS